MITLKLMIVNEWVSKLETIDKIRANHLIYSVWHTFKFIHILVYISISLFSCHCFKKSLRIIQIIIMYRFLLYI
jgi:hypothetical protein